MTRKDRQRFTREFKIEAVRLANESGRLVTDVARDLGISVQLLYKWQEDVIEQDISVENAVKEMEKHLEKLNEIVRKAKIKVYWKFAFTIIPIGLAGIGAVLATSPLAIPLFGAGALVSIAKFAKFDRNPEYQVSEHAPAVMFHDTRTLSG